MSLSLPPLPNLGHLKKHAKDVQNLVQRHKPRWKLADAQHAVARGYGFSSWPTLKAHVESVRRLADASIPLRRTRNREGDPSTREIRTVADGCGDAQDKPPIVGIWIARADPPQSLILEFAAAGDTITITQVALDASGHEVAATMVLRADGQDHPSEYGSEQVVRSTWIRPHLLETEHKKGGRVLARGTYEVSEEGNTLSVSTKGQVIVLDRS